MQCNKQNKRNSLTIHRYYCTVSVVHLLGVQLVNITQSTRAETDLCLLPMAMHHRRNYE